MSEVIAVFFAAAAGSLSAGLFCNWVTERVRKSDSPIILRSVPQPKREIFGKREKRAPKINDDEMAWRKENEMDLRDS